MRVLEGPVLRRKIFSTEKKGLGLVGVNYGIARFKSSQFSPKFPFAKVDLIDDTLPSLASYGLLQAYTGVKYEGINKTLYFKLLNGQDFTSFLSTDTGFGIAGLKNSEPFVNIIYGEIEINKMEVSICTTD